MSSDEAGVDGAGIADFGARTAKRGIVFLAGELVSSVFSLLVLIFASRFLGPSAFGLVAIAVAFSAFVGMGGNFGIGTALRQRLPRLKGIAERGSYISSGYAVACSVATLLMATGLALSCALAGMVYGNAALAVPIELASIMVLASVAFNITLASLVGIGRVARAAVINSVYPAVQLVGVAALLLYGYGVTGVMLGMNLGLLVATLLGLVYLGLDLGFSPNRPTKNIAKNLVGFSAPILVSNISVLGASNFAVVLLGVFALPSVVGNYGVAFKLGTVFQTLIVSNTFVLLPAFSEARDGESISQRLPHMFGWTLYYSLLMIAPLLAYAVANAAPIVRILFSSAYGLAPLYFAIISVGTVAGMFGSYAGTFILSGGDSKRFMRYQLAVVAIEVALLLALTPTLGAWGPLISVFAAAPVALDAIYMGHMARTHSLHGDIGRIAGVLLASAASYLAMLLVSVFVHGSIPLVVANALLLLAVYPPLLAVLGGIRAKDMDFLRRVASHFGAERLADPFIRYTSLFIR